MGDNACRHTRAVALFIQRQDCDFKDVFVSVEFADGSDRSVAAYRAAFFSVRKTFFPFFLDRLKCPRRHFFCYKAVRLQRCR
jgi:hypothetical protein